MSVPFIEKKDISLEGYRNGAGLDSGEIKFYQERGTSLWIPAYTKNINPKHLEPLHDSFDKTNREHWIKFLNQWMHDENYFLGKELGRSPMLGELVDHYDTSGSKFECTLDYILHHPENITVNAVGLNGSLLSVECFLLRADVIGQTDFGYLKRLLPSRLEEGMELAQ